ncbi:MAG: hypothetical protein V4808_13340 [Pseudomonadota bacterium]
MVHRSNGAGAPAGSIARAVRSGRGRKLLLGSTALIGMAIANPAWAQTQNCSFVSYDADLDDPCSGGGGSGGTPAPTPPPTPSPSPAPTPTPAAFGGGTITAPGATTEDPGSGQGVRVTNVTQANAVTVTGVVISQSVAGPATAALSIEGNSGTTSVNLGGSTLSTTVGGNAAYQQTSAGNNFLSINAANSFTGSYGINLTSANSFVDINTNGFNQTITAYGTAVAGINAVSSNAVGVNSAGSTITGFATGINAAATSTSFASVTTTGGSISATATGIRASGPTAIVDSQSAITAPVGIQADGTQTATVTTSGAGTLNWTSSGTGTGIRATVASGGTGNVLVNSGTTIGAGTAFLTGIDARNSGSGTTTVNSSAAITTVGSSAIGINAVATNATSEVTTTAGGTINGGQYGIQINAALAGQSSTVTVGAAIGGGTRPTTGINITGVNGVGGTNTVNANANISASGNAIQGGWSDLDTALNVAAGVTVTSQTAAAISSGRGVTVNNSGTMRGGTNGGSFGNAITNSSSPATVSITNTATGVISGGGSGINLSGTVTVTNAGSISGTIFTGVLGFSGGTVTNNTGGTIVGGTSAVAGYAVRFDGGASTRTVSNNATITGGVAGSIYSDGSGAATFNLNSGSTTSGLIKILGSSTVATTIAGTLTGDYDASTATGVQNLRLAGGTMQNATFGSGNDTFTWAGGTFGTVAGGSGTDTFAVDLGASVAGTLNLTTLGTNLTSIEAYRLNTGILTLTGARDGGPGWVVAATSPTARLAMNGDLTNITGSAITLNVSTLLTIGADADLSAIGDVITSVANGNNIQNAGTITSGTGLSSAIAVGSGSITNSGTITYAAGGAITTQGNGVLGSTNQLTVTNNAGAGIYGRWDGVRANVGIFMNNSGRIQGDRFAGVEISGGSVINNSATGRIYGATGEGAGLLINSGLSTVTNSAGGVIVGGGASGIYNRGTGVLTVNNSGTIATGSLDGSGNYVAGGTSFAIASGPSNITNNSGGTIVGVSGGVLATGNTTLINSGSITGTGAAGHGVQQIAAAMGVTNNSGSTISGVSSGVRVSGGTSFSVSNTGTISGTGAAGYGMNLSAGIADVTNNAAGSITGLAAGILFSAGSLSLNNAGTVSSASAYGISLAATGGTINNNAGGTISGASSAIYSTAAMTLTNRGTISTSSNGTAFYQDAVVTDFTGVTTSNILNSGSITSATYAGVNINGGAGVITNATGSSINGGNIAVFGVGVQIAGNAASGTVTNYGTIGSTAGRGIYSNNIASTIALHAGSTTGAITLGSANDTLAIYGGRGTASTAIVDGASGITLQNAGTLATAIYGPIDMGGGSDTIQLRGTGDGTAANGIIATLTLAAGIGAETISKLDSGSWTITGSGAGVTQINAGNGVGGLAANGILAFTGTSNLSAAIAVNGATIRADSAGAFGTGTITAMNPTIVFGASGTYANPIVLASSDTTNDPTRLRVTAGITARLTGAITQSGVPAQPLVFDGSGTAELTNSANNFAGQTRILNGRVVQINIANALGTGGVDISSGATLQFDNQSGTTRFVEGGSYTGAGTIVFTGGITAFGNGGNGNVVITQSAGGLIDLQSGTLNGSSSGQGFFTGNQGSLNIANGAIFDGVEGTIIFDRLTGSGTLRGGFGGARTTTIGVANSSSTFDGIIANSTNPGSILALTKAGTGTITLTGANTYTGVTTINGGTLAIQNGSVIADTSMVTVGASGIFQLLSSEEIGTLTGSGATTLGTRELTLTNASGTYTGALTGGRVFIDAGTWTYGGTRSGATGSAFNIGGDAVVLNVASTGSVQGGEYAGVGISGAGVTVNNLGSITNTGFGGDSAAGSAILITSLSGAATINNGSVSNSTASLTGRYHGIQHADGAGGTLVVNNYGMIRSTDRVGIVSFDAGATITNYAGATILGNQAAMDLQAGGTVTNAGTITSTTDMAILTRGAATTVINQTGGTITGVAGIDMLVAGSVTNAGTITGNGASAWGVYFRTNGGSITNQTGGLITGFTAATVGANATIINQSGATIRGSSLTASMGTGATLTNSGIIENLTNVGSGNNVMVSVGSGTVTNNAGGIIRQLNTASGPALVSYGALTLINGGTISSASTLYNAVGILGTATVTNTGSITTAGAIAIRITGTGSSVTNSGTIQGGSQSNSAGLLFDTGSGGTVTNQLGGLIAGRYGINAVGNISASNLGAINGTDAGVYLAAASGLTTITNGSVSDHASSIYGGSNGIRHATNAAGTLTVNNYASIIGNLANGIENQAGAGALAVNNFAGSSIVGRGLGGSGNGISMAGGALTLANAGTVSGLSYGVYSAGAVNITSNSGSITGDNGGMWVAGGTISNNVGGLIYSNVGSGIISNGATTITNSGSISAGGNNYGIFLSNGATTSSITNSAEGQISGYRGIDSSGVLTLVNSGAITGASDGTAIVLRAADSSVTNTMFATISGGEGVDFFGANGSVTNAGTISGISYGVLFNGSGTGTIGNTGSITASGGYGVYVASQAGNITNSGTISGTAAAIAMTGNFDNTITLNTGSVITGAIEMGDGNDTLNFNGGTIAGAIRGGSGSDVINVTLGAGGTASLNATTVTGFENQNLNSGTLTLTGSGQIGTNWAVLNGAELDVSGQLSNDDNAVALAAGATLKVLAGGSLDSIFDTVSGSGAGIVTVNNAGSITSGASAINSSGGLALSNSGTITGGTIGAGYGAYASGTLTVTNSGTITGGAGAAVAGAGGGTITNANGGSILAGSNAAISMAGANAFTLDLQTGSTVTGNVTSSGTGARTVTIAGALNGAYISSGSGVDTLTLNGGTMGSANLGAGDDRFNYISGTITGTIDGGLGTDSLYTNVGGGTVNLSNFLNFEIFGFTGSGTVTGPSDSPNAAIYAGDGTPGGTLTFSGTQANTGDIYVNGSAIRAATAGAFGTGTIHLIDPTAIFGATGTYANNISLEVVTPASNDPSTLSAEAGVTATLTGAITQGSGGAIDPVQPLVIAGAGTIVLANAGNLWTGTTTVNSGSTLQGTTASISGSSIVGNGTLAYIQPLSGTVVQDISGVGAVRVSGLGAGEALSFSGNISNNGGIDIVDASTVINTGTLASSGYGVEILAGGTFVNNGTVTGFLANQGSVAATISNNSTINGSVSNFGTGALTFNNALGATLAATGMALSAGAGAGALIVNNSGDISGTTSSIYSINAGTIVNNDGRIVSGVFNVGGYNPAGGNTAINLSAGGTVNNQAGGLIGGATFGLVSTGALTLDNAAGATIEATGTAVGTFSAPATITNAGLIRTTGTEHAIGILAGATITNTGTITGGSDANQGYAINAGGALNVTNSAGGTLGGGAGAILSFGKANIDLQAGSTTNGRVFLFDATGNTVNIAGTFNGALLAGGGNDNVTINSSATLGASTLNGGAGTDTLTLTGTANQTLNSSNVSLFETRVMNGTGIWTLTGVNGTAGTWAINSGTLATGAQGIGGSTGVTIGANGTLQLLASEFIGSLSGTGNVLLGANTLNLTSGTTSTYAGVIGGTGSVNVSNSTTLVLSGANTFTGVANVGGTGTLRLGAANVLADTVALNVLGTMDMQGFDETVGSASIGGTLNGTGTLTATNGYTLTTATVNANLGAGMLTKNGVGTATLNGVAGSLSVLVNAGTLALGASDRFADGAVVQVANGATLDLGAFNETVSQFALAGTLAGTGTLTATQYEVTGATVNGNLGAGTLLQLGGTSVLTGSSAAANVGIIAGTLALGASDRLLDTATLVVASGATLDLGAFDEMVGLVGLGGTLAGTGTLNATQYDLNGATVNANLGAGTLVNTGGVSTLNGTAGAATVAVNAGTLALGASDRLVDTATLTVASGATLNLDTFNDTVGMAGLSGTLAGTGTLTATQIELTGATVNGNVAGDTLVQLSGASTLSGTASNALVSVNGGTLSLGASDRIADTSNLAVLAGGTFDMAAFNDTVGIAALAGTLAGTGTLTATEYQLSGATVNANLGAGSLFNLSGISTLNGTHAGTIVTVQAGTLTLGASDRLADAAALTVLTASTFDLGAFDETVGTAALAGTLAGTGTLSANIIDLNGATVNANLGSGTLINSGGISTLNGSSAAANVGVNAGTLALGASDRLSDAATLAVASGATLDIGAFNDTVGIAALAGTLAGTGTLTATEYQLTGATVNANLGAGTLLQLGGTSVLNGMSGAASVGINAGTLALGGSDRLADAATVVVANGATFDTSSFNDTIGTLSLSGTLNGTGTLTAGEYQLNAGTVNGNLGAGNLFNVSGTSLLNGTTAAGLVTVQVGTLSLGASSRIVDTATLMVASGATFDTGAFNETVAAAGISGTLNGSGTLSAATIQLTGATVNGNVGGAVLVNTGGVSTLNGLASSTSVGINAGTLRLGASNRIADTSTVVIGSGATLDIGAFTDTVALSAINGTLAGTGTLSAAETQLGGATVNANLGAGNLFNVSGASVLNGTSAAAAVNVQGGMLTLGASERLANGSALAIGTGGTFNLAGFTETVGSLANGAAGGGTLALGSGRLVLAGNGDYGFSGQITGSGSLDHTGTGRLTLAGDFTATGRLDASAGTLAFLGTSLGSARVQGGTLIGNGTFGGSLNMTSGTLAPGGLLGGNNVVQPIGMFRADSMTISGGNLLFDFGGSNFNFASDAIRVTGAATLQGGTVNVNALSSTVQYSFSNQYVIVQAGTLTGTFANGGAFAAVATDPMLKWRLRYDLMPNSVVLQVQKDIDFAAGIDANTNPNNAAVGRALNGAAGQASDEWSATLNSIALLSPSQRATAYETLNGEVNADSSTATIMSNNLFLDMLRGRMGDSEDTLSSAGFAQSSLGGMRVATRNAGSVASRLMAAQANSEGQSSGAFWSQAYGGYQRLLGEAGKGQATLETSTAGLAMGAEGRIGDMILGIAGGGTEVGADVDQRRSNLDGRIYQIGGYASYDDGVSFASLTGNYYSGDFKTLRQINIGGALRPARARFDSKGYALSVAGGTRVDLGNGLRAILSASATRTRDSRDGFTETSTGGLGLVVAAADRDLFTATGEVKLGQWIKTGSGYAMPYVTAGVRYNAGDLDTLGNMRFSGAPAGTGAFQVQGAHIEPFVGTYGAGIDVRASDRVSLGVAVENAYGARTRESRGSMRIKIGF